MKIPNNYDRNANMGAAERLTPGGHKCVIKQVDETISKSGKQMLEVSLDTSAEDAQPKFYENRFRADQRPVQEKRWGCVMYIVLEGEYAEQNLNRFLGAVEHSNPEVGEFKPGADVDPREFKGLNVGVLFREEEYSNQEGEVRTAVKPAFWCNYNDAPDQKVPKPKLLPRSATDPTRITPAWAQAQTTTVTPSTAGFFDVPADALEDEGLPFK